VTAASSRKVAPSVLDTASPLCSTGCKPNQLPAGA
jgi:hypothetical protein